MKRLTYAGAILFSLLLTTISCGDDDTPPKDNIWTGPEMTFTKAANADWTLPENQDRISDSVTFTRQDNRQIYNYQWWQNNFGEDATGDDLFADFWDDVAPPSTKDFTATGGTKGVKWAILDSIGADNPWDENFAFYGTLGDPTHFYSFHNVATMIAQLNAGNTIVSIPNDFDVETESFTADGTIMTELVGKNLGIWLVEEDIYLSFKFTEWGSGGSGGALSYTRSTPD
ncbi:hypothetical protein ACFQ1M_06050 [Sungkyunkwania multivorans]|uniref:Uncharacterized protein n=1 Tax=Sungkyunkwania multivorans TaxID=1173618 RepID=A0ABW3CVD0_9FLAO